MLELFVVGIGATLVVALHRWISGVDSRTFNRTVGRTLGVVAGLVPTLAQAQQQVQTMQQLRTAVGNALGIGVILAAVACVFFMWRGITMDRSSGEWKNEIVKGIAVFAVVGIVNILFNIFFPGQNLTVSFQ
jgi:ABC-type spermidine/putrescine transport system permease subunit II